MIRWSLTAEFLSFITIVILFLYYNERGRFPTHRRSLYLLCLCASGGSILLNALCVYAIAVPDLLPLWLNWLLNSLYFLLCVSVCSLIAGFLFALLLEHVYDKRCLHRALAAIIALTAGFALLTLWNLRSGVLFFFDEAGGYHRGPLNAMGYCILGVELVMLVLCYLRNRSSVSRPMVRVMHVLPPLLVLMTVFQRLYPGLLLNGTLLAQANLIVFISFHTRSVELDSLTGIRNRASFFRELTLRSGGRQPLQLILISLAQFAQVNQKYGYPAGDALLYETARYLDGVFPSFTAFRFNNVEFVLLGPAQDESEACRRLDILERRFREPWQLGGLSLTLSVNLADVVYTGGSRQTPAQLIDFLEYAARLARQENRPLIRFDPDVEARFRRRQHLVDLMRSSIRQRRFQIWYQPVYCLHGRHFCSAEALLRLTDYDGAPISPGEFIPLAEETGLIDELSWIVLEEVCRFLGAGRAGPLQYVSINLSPRQFRDPSLIDRVRAALDRFQVPPGRLKIEITEQVFLEDTKRAEAIVSSLTDYGVRFFMDDFGTGYSNLSCVLGLPFEYIKLDRSLIAPLPDDPQAGLMVRTLIQLFHSLGKRLIAEGVETASQAELLCRCGADSIQGFYYAHPMPEGDFIRFLSAAPPSAAEQF